MSKKIVVDLNSIVGNLKKVKNHSVACLVQSVIPNLTNNCHGISKKASESTITHNLFIYHSVVSYVEFFHRYVKLTILLCIRVEMRVQFDCSNKKSSQSGECVNEVWKLN